MTPTSTCNKTMKAKRPREGGGVLWFFFGGFVLWWVLFFLYVFVKPRNCFIRKNLVITYKLNTIKGFCHKEKDFARVLVFLNFCHSLRKITKENQNQNQIVHCTCERVCTLWPVVD